MNDEGRTRMPRAVRIVLLVLLAAAVLVLLFTVVFPWVESNMEDPTLGALAVPVIPFARS